jgi:hypothetical protein
MKPISQNRKPRSVFRLDPPSCALPPKKVLVPDPESVPTAIIFYFHHGLPVDAANSIRVFGGWTLQIQMGPFQV